jgi:hypothetical protein
VFGSSCSDVCVRMFVFGCLCSDVCVRSARKLEQRIKICDREMRRLNTCIKKLLNNTKLSKSRDEALM